MIRDKIKTPSDQRQPNDDDAVLVGPSILLVDDQPARLLTYEAILGDLHLNFVRSLSGEDALKQLLKQDFAAIVLDVSMPGMDGFETARCIRGHHRMQQIPIIFVTGIHVTELDQLRGYEVGAIDYISVPVVPEILRSKIALLVELYNRRNELTRLNQDLNAARSSLEAERDEAVAARESIRQTLRTQPFASIEHPSEITTVFEAVRSEVGTIVDWRYSDANANALRILNRSRHELIGRLLSEVLPDEAQRLGKFYSQALNDRCPARYEATANGTCFQIGIFPLGTDWVINSAIEVPVAQSPSQPRIAAAENSAADPWLSALLESMTDEVYFTRNDGRYAYANRVVMSEFGHTAIDGIALTEIVSGLEVFRPDGSPRPITEAPPLRALQGETVRGEEQLVRIPRSGEIRRRIVNATPVRNLRGQITGSVAIVRDITARTHTEAALRQRELRTSALLKLGDSFRTLTTPADLAFAAARLLGETLNVSRCGYGTIDPINETIAIERDWNAPGINSIAGVLHFREYGTYIDELKRGETVICSNADVDPRTRATATNLAAIQVRSFVNMPIVEQGNSVALLYLNHEHPRRWDDDEMLFVREVADRTRIAVERRRVEQAIATDLIDMQLLSDLAARLITEGNTNLLLDEILAAAVKITHATAGTIQLLEESSQDLLLTVTIGLHPTLVEHFKRVSARSTTSCGAALSRGERTQVSFDVAAADDPDGSMRLHWAHGLQSAQSTPLVSRSGSVLGMLSTHWNSTHVISTREHRFLDLLARFAADMIQRCRDEQVLREDSKRKDAFLAVLAHELRNPLASLSAAAQLLGKATLKPEMTTIARDALQRQVSHMAHLLDDLLDVARITNGLIKLQPQQVNLADALRSAVDTIAPQLEHKQHRLNIQLQSDAAFVSGDPDRLNQIFVNLLSNAVKYTPPAGEITVRLYVSIDQQAHVSIADNGIGIPMAKRSQIFEMFSSASGSKGGSNGLGIGLSIAKSLVHMHGGTIEVRSDGENRGSEFIINLPLVIADIQSAPADIPELEQQDVTSLRILIADDNADNALSWMMLLQQQGHQVRIARDGREGLEEAKRFLPDLALLDIGMPQLNGYEVARAIRDTECGRHIVLVAISGWGQQRDVDEAYAAGFDRHLTKPAKLADVTAIIRTVKRLVS